MWAEKGFKNSKMWVKSKKINNQNHCCTFIKREKTCWRLHKRSWYTALPHPCAPCWLGVLLKASGKVAQTVAVLACTISHKLFQTDLSPHVSANTVKTHPELVRCPKAPKRSASILYCGGVCKWECSRRKEPEATAVLGKPQEMAG